MRKYQPNKVNLDGFTLVELIGTVTIIGLISILSVPSFLNWRRLEIVNAVRNELLVSLSGISDESKRWGATCTINMGYSLIGGKPLDIDCRTNGSIKSQDLCLRSTGCNISTKNNSVQQLPSTNNIDNLVTIVASQPVISFTPRGHLASDTDIVFTVQGTNALGGNPPTRCVLLKAFTGVLKDGEYVGQKPGTAPGARAVDRSLDASRCIIRG